MKFAIIFAAAVLTPVVATAMPMSAKTYVGKAGAADLFETESSKLVQDSKDPKITAYAQMMIGDHAKSTTDVVAAAKADGLTPGEPMLAPNQKAMLTSLKAATGKRRDALYKKDQVAAHKATLAFQKEYAASGTKPNLKATAGKIVPVVEQHLSMANDMTAMAGTAK